jgi:EmrB/QacA subfamily drug resistance transporter
MKHDTKKLEPIPRSLVIIAWIMVLGLMAPMLDSTMINIAVHQLSNQFHTDLATVQWTVTGFILAMGAAAPFSSWLVAHFSGKKVYFWAEIGFGFASLLAGISWNIESLIIFRLIQGFTGGLIMPVMFTLLVDAVGGDKMGRIMAIIGVPMTLGPMLGPIIGGIIVEYATWRFIFFLNVPVIAIAAFLLIRKVPETTPKNKQLSFDFIGVTLLIIMSTTVVYGIVQASNVGTFNNSKTLIFTSIGLVALVGYILYANKQPEKVVMPLRLFTHRNFSGSMLGIFLSGFVTSGPMLLLPLFFQSIRGDSVIVAAMALIPQSIGMLISRGAIGKMIDLWGARWVTIIGVGVTLVGTIPFIYFNKSSDYWLIAVVIFIRGIGGAAIKSATQVDAYVGIQKSDSATASLSSNIFQQIGSGFATAVLATIVTSYNTIHHVTSLSGLTTAFQRGFLWSAILVVLILIPAFMLTNRVRTK